jgi:polyisoprenoid-binding protein YceI
MRKNALFMLTMCLLLGVCAVQPALSAEKAAAPASVWQIDPVHSAIIWSISHNNGVGIVYGRFNTFNGTIIADEEHPGNSSVEVMVDAASVDTGTTARDEHLRTADFFNVAQFAGLSFKSTSVSAVAGHAGEYEVSGALTLLGVTKPITMTIKHTATGKDKKGNGLTGFTGSFSIKRSEFGMLTGIPGIGDEVAINLAFECDEIQPTSVKQ